MSFIAMKFDLREEQLHSNQLTTELNELRTKKLTPEEERRLLRPAKETGNGELTDEEFDDLDLSEYDD